MFCGMRTITLPDDYYASIHNGLLDLLKILTLVYLVEIADCKSYLSKWIL